MSPEEEQRVLAQVVAAFARHVPTLDGLSDEARALATHARDLFVAAGAERLARSLDRERWLQVGALCTSEAQAERFMGLALAPFVARLRAAGAFDACFVMQKEPGLRIRFQGKDLDARLRPELVRFLEGAKAEGLVRGHEWGAYDAETHQFGGEEGMRVAHTQFDADTRMLLEWHAARLRDGDDAVDERETLSLLVLNDLTARVAGDGSERWDIWRNLRLAGRLPRFTGDAERSLREDLAANREVLARMVFRPAEVAAELTPSGQALVTAAFAANEKIAGAFREAAQRGVLTYGPRHTLPFLFIFHWNRWGFDWETQAAHAFFVESLLSPKGETR